MGEVVKMALIATYPKVARLFLQLTAEKPGIEAVSKYASFERAVEIAKELERTGQADVILSRGGTAAQIKNAVSIPVVFIPVTPFDVIKIIHQLDPGIKEAAFIHYRKNVLGIQEIARMYQIRIEEYSFVNYLDIENAVKDAKSKGIRTIIGGEVAVRVAKNMGMEGYQISAGKQGVDSAIEEALHMLDEKRKEQKKALQMKTAYDSLKEGIIVMDEEDRIVILNPIAAKLLKNQYKTGDRAGEDVISKEYRDFCQKGRDVPVYLKQFGKAVYTVAHFPVFKDGRFMGIVSRMEDVTKIQEMEQKTRKELHSKGFVAKYCFEDIITEDSSMKKVVTRARVYSRTDSSVLIQGESGTGKELLAQSIHNGSLRREGPFVAVNCAAIPENLLESELFGYEAGAFTGARKEGKAGLFEMAHRGTLFLDEIGEISKNLQTRLLRVLQEKEIMRVGGNRIIPVDVRIISATNQDLKALAKEGEFREDLYYRLNVLEIKIPPLRERRGDIGVLARKFLSDYLSPSEEIEGILSLLSAYDWPGNIRELENAMERYGVLSAVLDPESFRQEEIGEILGISEVKREEKTMELAIPAGEGWNEIMCSVERQIARHYLEEFGNNQEMAAKALGIGRTTFWRKLKEN